MSASFNLYKCQSFYWTVCLNWFILHLSQRIFWTTIDDCFLKFLPVLAPKRMVYEGLGHNATKGFKPETWGYKVYTFSTNLVMHLFGCNRNDTAWCSKHYKHNIPTHKILKEIKMKIYGNWKKKILPHKTCIWKSL